METVVLAVGSTRQPKIGAVAEALKAFGHLLHPGAQFQVIGTEAPSGVSHTPLSRTELMAGARGRAEALVELAGQRNEPWKYFIGLEGGLDIEQQGSRRLVFLESWAFVCDGAGREAFGQSGAILLPEPLAAEVVDRGMELSVAIDAYAGAQGIRDGEGAWGVLTGGLMSRQESFRLALINAFAPFFNARIYREL